MIDILILSIDVFLFSTYLGVSAYLTSIYTKWSESTIGLWSVGTYGATISVLMKTIGNFPLVGNEEALISLSYIISFVSFSLLVVAHQFARRDNQDLFLLAMTAGILAILVHLFWTEVEFVNDIGVAQLDLSNTQSFENILYIYFILLFITLSRDSAIIYRSSILRKNRSYLKSTAITHLISWQFFFWGFVITWIVAGNNSKSTLLPLVYEISMILLLVPILTLGSRPFDWAREGHEPRMIMLLDKHGNVAYSWQKESITPLLLEGGSFSSIEQIIAGVMNDRLSNMNLVFDNAAVYMRTRPRYLSVLVTDGPHPSFDILLGKIHGLLVQYVDKPVGDDVLPMDIMWLLNQLLPQNVELTRSET